MRSIQLDIERYDCIKAVGQKIEAEFPNFNVLINNAGIQRP
jgi:short-subunit dehydrogenase involved in D-alanine esterification of teichoic acids